MPVYRLAVTSDFYSLFTQFGQWFQLIITTVNSACIIKLGSTSISLFNVLVIFLLISMVITIFWKGARG